MKAIVIDTETTGINEPVLVEAAWIEVDAPCSLHLGAQFEKRFNPGKPIEFGAMATHHITNEDVAQCPPASEFGLPDGVEYLIGHNVDFDWKVIGEPKVKRICTLAFSRAYWPDDSHTLGAMLYRLNVPNARELLRGAHSALADARNCLTLLSYIVPKSGCRTWESLWQACELARVPTVMSFGKHKGRAIKDVPSDYKRWLLAQPDVDEYLRKALKA